MNLRDKRGYPEGRRQTIAVRNSAQGTGGGKGLAYEDEKA